MMSYRIIYYRYNQHGEHVSSLSSLLFLHAQKSAVLDPAEEEGAGEGLNKQKQ